MDGVLVDTTPHHNRSWQLLAERENVRLELSHLDALRSLSRRDSLTTLLDGQTLPEEIIEHLLAEKNRLYLALIEEAEPELLPGVQGILEAAKTAGVPLGLASSSRNARLVCERLQVRPFFSAFADGTDVKHGKPAPELYVRVVRELGLPARRCLVVEDGAAGVRAARGAGCRVVGLGPQSRLSEADAVLKSLDGISLEELLTL